jgi:hypothetical protein
VCHCGWKKNVKVTHIEVLEYMMRYLLIYLENKDGQNCGKNKKRNETISIIDTCCLLLGFVENFSLM